MEDKDTVKRHRGKHPVVPESDLTHCLYTGKVLHHAGYLTAGAGSQRVSELVRRNRTEEQGYIGMPNTLRQVRFQLFR